ncbi:hypothetical protein CDD81_840 [Ophiocordyceps australis]|uniref:Uncharacterized protein n=1 Tax=Ophiocordyceps australis TaxID=1399860 RepID=A0A2C5XFT3_9HYPO|nr:hypothetical protein CDD81_840 [Ophiocordyceps australis]
MTPKLISAVVALALSSVGSATTTGGHHHHHGEVVVTGEHCAKACTETYWTCREELHANIGGCSHEYAVCLGYNPFKDPGHTPSHCVVPHETKVFITEEDKARCVCAQQCTVQWKHCGIELEHCRHEYQGCLGYNPFEKGPHHRPSACVPQHHRPHHTIKVIETVMPAPHMQQDACARDCTTKYNTCRGMPGANQSTCAAEYSACLGYNPFEKGADHVPMACMHEPGTVVEYPPAVVTGAAENMRPAVALLGLVAAAML